MILDIGGYQWADRNHMQLNPRKCATMTVSFFKNEADEQY